MQQTHMRWHEGAGTEGRYLTYQLERWRWEAGGGRCAEVLVEEKRDGESGE